MPVLSKISQSLTLPGIQGSLAAHHDDFLAPVLTERPHLSRTQRRQTVTKRGLACVAAFRLQGSTHELQLALPYHFAVVSPVLPASKLDTTVWVLA